MTWSRRRPMGRRLGWPDEVTTDESDQAPHPAGVARWWVVQHPTPCAALASRWSQWHRLAMFDVHSYHQKRCCSHGPVAESADAADLKDDENPHYRITTRRFSSDLRQTLRSDGSSGHSFINGMIRLPSLKMRCLGRLAGLKRSISPWSGRGFSHLARLSPRARTRVRAYMSGK